MWSLFVNFSWIDQWKMKQFSCTDRCTFVNVCLSRFAVSIGYDEQMLSSTCSWTRSHITIPEEDVCMFNDRRTKQGKENGAHEKRVLYFNVHFSWLLALMPMCLLRMNSGCLKWMNNRRFSLFSFSTMSTCAKNPNPNSVLFELIDESYWMGNLCFFFIDNVCVIYDDFWSLNCSLSETVQVQLIMYQSVNR